MIMWNTAEGCRTLGPQEGYLLAEVTLEIVDEILLSAPQRQPFDFGIPLYDAMTPMQQVVVFEHILAAMLDPTIEAPQTNALIDSTIAVLYATLYGQITCEIEMVEIGETPAEEDPLYRTMVIAALREPRFDPESSWDAEEAGFGADFDVSTTDLDTWAWAVDCLRDRVLADEDWALEGFAIDLPPESGQAVKQSLGIDNDYFIGISPDATLEDARAAREAILKRILPFRNDVPF